MFMVTILIHQTYFTEHLEIL